MDAQLVRDLFDMTLVEGNFAHKFLGILFPEDPAGSTLTRMLGIVSSVLVAGGAGWLGWQIIEGIAKAAHNAQSLSERYSVWSPLRAVVGFGLLAPLTAAGMSAIHHLLFALVMIGSNLGDAVHERQIADVVVAGRPLVTSSAVGKSVVSAVLEREVCAATLAEWTENNGGERPEPISAAGRPAVRLERASWYGSYSQSRYQLWDWGDCGSLSFPLPADELAFGEARRAATESVIVAVRDLAGRVAPLYRTGAGLMQENPDGVRSAIGSGVIQRTVATWLNERGAEWDRAVADAAAEVAKAKGEDGRSNVAAYQRAGGWMTAGMTSRLVAQTSALVQGLTAEAPTLTDPGLDEVVKPRYDAALALIRQAVQVQAPTLAANDLAEPADEVSGFLTKTLAPLSRSLSEAGLSSEWSPDPVGDLVSFGHVLIGAFWAMVAAGALAMAASDSFFAAFVGAGGALGFILDMVKPLVWGVLLVGVLYAVIMPSVVFVLSVLSIVSWLVAIAEAVIALPLYATLMVRLQASEFWDQALKPGLYLLLSVVLRPALMVLSAAFGSVLISAALNLLNQLWAPAFLGQQGGHVGGPETVVVGLILLAWLQWQVFLRLATLTLTMPERIFAWTGSQMQGTGDDHAGAAMGAGMAAGLTMANRAGVDTRKLAGKEDGEGKDDKPAGLSRGA